MTLANQSCTEFLVADFVFSANEVATLDPRVLDIISKGQKPYLGLVIKTRNKELLLAIGSFFGNNHAAMLRGLDQKGIRIKSIFWGGELLISNTESRMVLHAANETSGSLYLLNRRQEDRRFPDPFPELSFLRGVDYTPSNIRWLKAFVQNKGLLFSPSFKSIKYSNDHEHILPQIDPGSSFRHDFNNELNSIIISFALLGRGNTPSVGLEHIQKRLEKLILYTKYYLYLDDTFMEPKTVKYLNEYIAKIEPLLVQDSSTWDLSSAEWQSLQVLTFKTIKIIFKEKDKTVLHIFRQK